MSIRTKILSIIAVVLLWLIDRAIEFYEFVAIPYSPQDVSKSTSLWKVFIFGKFQHPGAAIMVTIIAIVLILFILFGDLIWKRFFLSQKAAPIAGESARPPDGFPSIAGVWEETGGAIVHITQNHEKWMGKCSYSLKGGDIVEWEISGTIGLDRKIEGTLYHTRCPHDWKVKQIREGRLSSDANEIIGTAIWEGGARPYTWMRTTPNVNNVQTHGRIIVDASPDRLLKFFEDYTRIEEQRLLEPYIDQWKIIRDAEITDITQPHPLVLCVYTKQKVRLIFNADWKPRVSVLSKGSRITAIGQIKRVEFYLELENCEIINS